MTTTRKPAAAKAAPASKPASKRAPRKAKAVDAQVDAALASGNVEKAVTIAVESDRIARLNAAKAEAKAVKAWEKGGSKGERPSTANLDAIESRSKAAKPVNLAELQPKRAKVAMTYFRDGKPMSRASNKFSCLAYQCTKGVGGDEVARISTSDLVALLAKAGIEDPAHTTWTHTLPNGVTIGAAPAS